MQDDNFEFEGFHFLLDGQDSGLFFNFFLKGGFCFGSDSETPMTVTLHSFLKEYK